ncbi:unnamed protein product [Dracunculus medinensis]|uniref:Uncharacterized protein n=1 Tax=Dracunculus medinensis TaxID=318479 RepID=A0A3P7PJ29_DRAME|nr:unnamed protein product [Dracunculus medinensis]
MIISDGIGFQDMHKLVSEIHCKWQFGLAFCEGIPLEKSAIAANQLGPYQTLFGLDRLQKRKASFIRLGRSLNNNLYEREIEETKRKASFIRLGRTSIADDQLPYGKRKASFIRLGRNLRINEEYPLENKRKSSPSFNGQSSSRENDRNIKKRKASFIRFG